MIDQAVEIHRAPGVGRDPHASNRDGRVVGNRGLDDDRHAALLVLVARDCHAAGAVYAAGEIEDGIEHSQGARVVRQVPPPNLYRIDPGREGEFVHERLDGEDVHLRPEAA